MTSDRPIAGDIAQHPAGEPPRRMGAQGSQTWQTLVAAAETLLIEQGYAAVTARRVAETANLSPQIVYFYFKNMDELFAALFRKISDAFLEALATVTDQPAPLTALWELASDPKGAVLFSELISLSNHRPSIRLMISEFGKEQNRLQTEIIAAHLERVGLDRDAYPAQVIASLIENLGKGLALGDRFEIESHSRARGFVSEFLKGIG